MNPISKLKLISYLILIMYFICHFRIVISSKNLYQIQTHPQQLIEFKGEVMSVTSFSHNRFKNFTQFYIINNYNHQSLYVVCQNNTILEIDLESMKISNNYTIIACSLMMMPCEERILINHLSEIHVLDSKMLWLCYILLNPNNYNPPLTNCMILKNKAVTTDVKWHKYGYTSNSDQHKTLSIQTKEHIFIGSFVDNSLFIQRTKLPNILGKIDSSKDLVTPMANFYFEKNSKFLETFETESEIYFVVVEPVSAKSYSIFDCLMSPENRIIYVTRLIRICKKDEGGAADHNEFNFGTIAKADIVCPIGTGKDEFIYNKAISVTWTNSKLYVLFENQKNSPHGKVVCYFDLYAFKIVFNGPMRSPLIYLNSQNSEKNLPNPLLDVCEKLSSGQLSKSEKVTASSLSLNGLYRTKKIVPVVKTPIINFRNKDITQIKAFSIDSEDPSSVLIIHYDMFIEIFSHTESNELCDIGIYKLGSKENVFQISGLTTDNNVYIIISTSDRIIRLKLNNCEKYTTKDKCLKEAPNICGWDRRTMSCSSLNDKVDINRWERSSCKHAIDNSVWSIPNICYVNDSQIKLKCICKYCTNEIMCSNRPKLEIMNCTGVVEIGEWNEWGAWSTCSSETKTKIRKRECSSKFPCIGQTEESKICTDNNKNAVRSVWTQWYSVANTNTYYSFRSKCSTDLSGPSPTIEIREMICENTCQENLFKWHKWSKWSDCTSQNVQYRLYNCSKLSQCPANKIQIQNCESVSKKINSFNEKDNSYGTIHIALAVLVCSIIWVFILIFISIILFKLKLNSHQNVKSSKSPRTLYRDRPMFMKRQFSETSNDYISSDIKSTIYDLDYMPFSHNENLPSTSKYIASQIPLVTEQKALVASI